MRDWYLPSGGLESAFLEAEKWKKRAEKETETVGTRNNISADQGSLCTMCKMNGNWYERGLVLDKRLRFNVCLAKKYICIALWILERVWFFSLEYWIEATRISKWPVARERRRLREKLIIRSLSLVKNEIKIESSGGALRSKKVPNRISLSFFFRPSLLSYARPSSFPWISIKIAQKWQKTFRSERVFAREKESEKALKSLEIDKMTCLLTGRKMIATKFCANTGLE